MSRRCPTCGEHAAVEPGPGREATVGTVAGAAGELPRSRCAAGHVATIVTGAEVVEAAVRQVHAAMPFARARRLRRDEACTSCGEPLTMPVRRTDWPVTLERPGGIDAVLTLRLDVPATRCPGCGADHVPVRSQPDLDATVRALLSG